MDDQIESELAVALHLEDPGDDPDHDAARGALAGGLALAVAGGGAHASNPHGVGLIPEGAS